MGFVLLLARQRTGTGALNTALEKHPNIKYLNEIFNEDNAKLDTSFFRFYERQVRMYGRKIIPNLRFGIFERYMKAMRARYKAGTMIIDTKYNNLHHLDANWRGPIQCPTLLEECMNRDIRIMHLTRRNRLKTFVSGALADINRVWHAFDISEIHTRSAVIDPNALMSYLDVTEKEDEIVSLWIKHYHKLIEFDYADVFTKSGEMNAGMIQNILDFLGEAHVPGLQPSIFKQAPAELAESIANFDEVKQALLGTRHAWMLTD